MNIINSGGSAFPYNRDISNAQEWEEVEGMTLRDYFAGQALMGLCSTTDNEGIWQYGTTANVSEVSYKISDAMLKEREK